MKDMICSFIVPIYNAEKYLCRCINSILSGMKGMDELILVDDGSTDTSGSICDRYCDKYENVIAIHQKNSGESVARNTGISNSRGKWIVFVDADDYLDVSYRDILDKYFDEKCDYILFSYIQDDGKKIKNRVQNKSVKDKCQKKRKNIIEIDEKDRENLVIGCFRANQKFADEKEFNSRTAWGKAFRRQFILENNLVFPKGVFIGEDCLFMVQVYALTEHAKYVPEIFYHYFFENNDSITNRYKPNLEENIKLSNMEISSWLKKNPFYEAAYKNYCLNTIVLHLRDDFFHKENKRSDKENKVYVRSVIKSGGYADAYKIAKKSGEIKNYSFSKRIVFWMAIHGYYRLLKIAYQIKYR